MRKIFGIGETVLDIIFNGDQPVSAVPGGSVYNSMISLGRAGASASFISEVGDDRIGRRIVSFLQENNVNADGVSMFHGTKSPLSLAFLNEQRDAEYIFYKDHPNDRLDFALPHIDEDDIVLFGSYYALNPVIRQQVEAFLRHAHDSGAILYYDVNFRPSHAGEKVRLRSSLLDNFLLADFVRGSRDDFNVLFGTDAATDVYDSEVSFHCKDFIYTSGSAPIQVFGAGGVRRSYDVSQIEAVSTIGAGDNFNAGFVYALVRYGIRRADIAGGLTPAQWDALIACAQGFSTECCKSIENFISVQYGAAMREALR